MRSLYLAFLLAVSPAICVGEIVSFEWDGVSDDRVSHYQLGVGSVSGKYYPSNEVSAPQTTTTVDLSEESFVAVRSRGFFSDEPESPEDPIPDPTWHVSVWSNEVVWAATLPITQPENQVGLWAFIEESTEMALSTNSTLSALNSARNRWAESQTHHALRGTPSRELGNPKAKPSPPKGNPKGSLRPGNL